MADLDFGQVHLPPGWFVSASITLLGPPEETPAGLHKGKSTPIHPNVNLTISPVADPNATADELRQVQRTNLGQELPGFKIVEEKAIDSPGGVRIPALTYTFQTPSGLSVQQVQVVYLEAGYAHFV